MSTRYIWALDSLLKGKRTDKHYSDMIPKVMKYIFRINKDLSKSFIIPTDEFLNNILNQEIKTKTGEPIIQWLQEPYSLDLKLSNLEFICTYPAKEVKQFLNLHVGKYKSVISFLMIY